MNKKYIKILSTGATAKLVGEALAAIDVVETKEPKDKKLIYWGSLRQ